ncbi:hypothetical protein Ga0466249_000135 [Sporomusaceae bacterium BoRhaA]|nr:hypothetical protein [Pelorhabdus rhamnosifermentans]
MSKGKINKNKKSDSSFQKSRKKLTAPFTTTREKGFNKKIYAYLNRNSLLELGHFSKKTLHKAFLSRTIYCTGGVLHVSRKLLQNKRKL